MFLKEKEVIKQEKYESKQFDFNKEKIVEDETVARDVELRIQASGPASFDESERIEGNLIFKIQTKFSLG